MGDFGSRHPRISTEADYSYFTGGGLRVRADRAVRYRLTVAMTDAVPPRDSFRIRGIHSSRRSALMWRYSSTYRSSPETATPVGDQASSARSTTETAPFGVIFSSALQADAAT